MGEWVLLKYIGGNIVHFHYSQLLAVNYYFYLFTLIYSCLTILNEFFKNYVINITLDS